MEKVLYLHANKMVLSYEMVSSIAVVIADDLCFIEGCSDT